MKRYVLPNGKAMYLKALLPAELDALLLVTTTVEQAKQIHERNKQLLAAMLSCASVTVNIGCPHCSRADISSWECEECRWTQAIKLLTELHELYDVHTLSRCGRGELPCCGFKFGGVSLYATGGVVEYGVSEAYVNYDEPGEVPQKARENSIAFLTAHMDWARAVIKMGGTRVPEEYEGRIEERAWR